ncbi:hypothetical protein [Flammeovirga sp. SubArs3]|uniref:hypothetical protein n=1 Tax=Flammeovirga sp. SubArs3 TaxID=2995316 RepID=UPI00248B1D17|nr:hypothetical protein [Flammeovirga sp. SubArs3]
MEKIKFIKVPQWAELLMHAFAIVLVVYGSGTIESVLSAMERNIIMGTGFAVLIIFQSKVFWWKHVVDITKTGIYIKVNTKKGIRFRFKDILSSSLKKDILTITLKSKEEFEISLKNIDRNDVQELNYLLMSKVIDKIER